MYVRYKINIEGEAITFCQIRTNVNSSGGFKLDRDLKTIY